MEFRADHRKSADYRKANTSIMITIAKSLTEEEIKTASEYFSSIKWAQPWITVKETDMVPKTRVAGGMFLTIDDGGNEPIGNRIIEVPENTEATEILRNPRSGFIAYVPTGSLKKGLQLVMSGVNGKTTQCTVCHGDELKGIGPVPGIAGKSPSYLVRQLWDMKTGMRRGAWIDLMKPVADKLTEEEMLNIAAYASSRPPQ
jgi:cytochrome c553